MKTTLCRIGVTLAIGSGITFAQAPSWSRVITGLTHPQARFGAAFVYDVSRDQIAMFGGVTASPGGPLTLGDTWVSTLRSWTPVKPAASPSARYGPGAAYDVLHQQTVLFGGATFINNGVVFSFGDTWTWDGTNWTAKTPVTSPPARYFPSISYDASRQQVVLFGGVNSSGYLSDTWIWDGTNWIQKFPANSPPARSSAPMAFDALRQVNVIFGGSNPSGALADTWTWDGNNWTQQFPVNSPAKRYGQGFAFDGSQGQSVMFAGTNEGGNLADTWVWDGSNWTQMFPSNSPSMRFYTMTAFNSHYGKVVLFGGGQGTQFGDIFLFDVWTWD